MSIIENIQQAGIVVKIDGLKLHELQMAHIDVLHFAGDALKELEETRVKMGDAELETFQQLQGMYREYDKMIGSAMDVKKVIDSHFRIFTKSVIFADADNASQTIKLRDRLSTVLGHLNSDQAMVKLRMDEKQKKF